MDVQAELLAPMLDLDDIFGLRASGELSPDLHHQPGGHPYFDREPSLAITRQLKDCRLPVCTFTVVTGDTVLPETGCDGGRDTLSTLTFGRTWHQEKMWALRIEPGCTVIDGQPCTAGRIPGNPSLNFGLSPVRPVGYAIGKCSSQSGVTPTICWLMSCGKLLLIALNRWVWRQAEEITIGTLPFGSAERSASENAAKQEKSWYSPGPSG